MIGRAFKFIKTVIKWTIRVVILAVIVIALWYGFRYLTDQVSAQAGHQCQEITEQNPGGKVVVYKTLAEWLKTQSTSFVSITDAYYEKGKKGDQIVIKYSTLNNWYKGKQVLDQETLERYCQ